jgi:hypothetical protein
VLSSPVLLQPVRGLRRGNAAAGQCPSFLRRTERWRETLEPIVERYQKRGMRLLFRADAAFAKPEVYEYLEPRHIGYVIRLPANEVLQEHISPSLKD